jgi:hypothetical protein
MLSQSKGHACSAKTKRTFISSYRTCVGAEVDERTSGTSLATILLARPSKIAVLPTPGGPINYKIYVVFV